MQWLQARYAEESLSPVNGSELSALNEIKAEMTKNRKRMKSMTAILEEQDKLIKTLAVKLGHNFQMPDSTAGKESVGSSDGGLGGESVLQEKDLEEPDGAVTSSKTGDIALDNGTRV